MSKKEKKRNAQLCSPVALHAGSFHSAYAGLLTSGFDSCLPQTSPALASSCNLNDKNLRLLLAHSPLINFPFCSWHKPTLSHHKLFCAALFWCLKGRGLLQPAPPAALTAQSPAAHPTPRHLGLHQPLLLNPQQLLLALPSDFSITILPSCYYSPGNIHILFGFLTVWTGMFDC